MIRFALLFLFLSTSVYPTPQPNVLFIAVDDMNDWISTLGGIPERSILRTSNDWPGWA